MSLFTTQAAAAVTALQATFGEPATFTAPPSAPVACRVILSRVDAVIGFGGPITDARAPGWRAEVSQTELPTRPRVGIDTLTVTTTTYAIRDVQEDIERTAWVLDIHEG